LLPSRNVARATDLAPVQFNFPVDARIRQFRYGLLLGMPWLGTHMRQSLFAGVIGTIGVGIAKHRHALMLALALASLVATEQAQAQGCAPTSPVSNMTVTCSSNTTNQNGTDGFGTNTDTGNVYNVLTGVSVSGTDFGILAGATANIKNAGTITGTGPNGVGVGANNLTISSNTGTISGVVSGVVAGNADITNANLITGGVQGIFTNGDSTVANSGTISAMGPSGVAIFVDDSLPSNRLTLSNSSAGMITANGTDGVAIRAGTLDLSGGNAGTISGSFEAIVATSASIANSGTISQMESGGTTISIADGLTLSNSSTGLITANGSNGVAVSAGGSVNITGNAGTISAMKADSIAIVAGGSLTLSNLSTGKIQADGANGVAIAAGTITMLSNAGVISANGRGGEAINADTINMLSNSGSISGDSIGIDVFQDVTVVNSGSISGSNFGIISFEGDVIVTNSGTISGGSAKSGISASGSVNVTNTRTGIISGGFGIIAEGNQGIGSTITNAGTIIGTSGTAILLSNQADTLNLLPGSKIVGVVDMEHGNDTVNALVSAPTTKVSSLSTVTIPTLINFDGKINTSFNNGGFAGPTAMSGMQLATLDPTALAQTDRTLADFTGGVSSLVAGRLNGASPAGGGNMLAMAYAADGDKSGSMFTKAPAIASTPAPITVWTSSFGGQRIQDGTDQTLRANSTAWGAALGIDRKIQPNWLVGGFVGGGSGSLNVDQNSQSVTTDYVFGGVYSRFEWAAHFFDFTLQGGSTSNKSQRTVLDNLVPETARANYNGWFVSPEIAYGFRYALGDYVLTPTARLRYIAGQFDGYSETGSAETLSIGSRTVQDLEERAEVDLSRTTSFFGDHVLKTNVHGGVIGLQRVGDSNISAVLIGQSLTFAAPGKSSTIGAVAGAGFDYHVRPNVALFGAIEGMTMSDQSRLGTAKGGVRVAF
jgi:outer membrane autotransporter protein